MPWRVRIKLFLKKILPIFLFNKVIAVWRSTFSRFFTDADINKYYTADFLATHPATIVGGPFAGMPYITESAGSTYLLKLIGCYEAVLHPYVQQCLDREYQTIIDIGCAEGCYLIGIGRQSNASLIGYDTDARARTLCAQLAEKNNCAARLSIRPECTSHSLNDDITEHTLLICDAEGFEAVILDPSTTPTLTQVQTMIIETHEFAAPGVVQTLKNRFADSHTITVVTFETANPESYPYLAALQNKKHQYALLRERGEQEQQWLIMEKK